MEIQAIHQIFKKCNYQLSTDSRKPIPGGIFLALKGEKFNGNAFAAQSLEAGVAYVIIDEAQWMPAAPDERYILVEDGLSALQQLATFHRNQYSIPLIAVCGSNGKTTTKELIVAVLRTQFQVLYTEGNLNNHIGVPLTLLRLRPEHEIAVIEMGANHLKEIADLCEISRPTHGLITSIGKDHLEGYGSVENVARSNQELFDFLQKSGGKAWINTNDPFVNDMNVENLSCIQYGNNQSFNAKIVSVLLTGMRISLMAPEQETPVHIETHLAGRHNLQNILAAWTIGHGFGIKSTEIGMALSEYKPSNNRSQLIEKSGRQILMDAYNANPSSVEASLEFFYSVVGDKKAVILGDMFELGEYAEIEHQRILEKALEEDSVKVIACGKFFHQAAGIFAHRNLRTYPNYEAIEASKDQVRLFLQDCTQILVKGSRGMAMERMVEIF